MVKRDYANEAINIINFYNYHQFTFHVKELTNESINNVSDEMVIIYYIIVIIVLILMI